LFLLYSVSTKELTDSFGWNGYEAFFTNYFFSIFVLFKKNACRFIQHDVQELCRVVLDNLIEKLKVFTLDFYYI
jgi:hypothetical protein